LNFKKYTFLVLILLVGSGVLFAKGMYVPSQDTTKRVIIENADNQIIDNAQKPSVKYFRGNIRAYHEGAYFYCDSAKLIENILYAYGNISIIQNDTIKIFCDELYYDGDSLYSYLKGKVILINNDEDYLYTDYLDYDMKNKTAYYRDKALIKSGETELTSKKGSYNLNSNWAKFQEKVKVTGEDNFLMVTDSMEFNTKEEIANWHIPALIYQDSAELFSNTGTYHIKSKEAWFIGNAQYKKDDTETESDSIYYNGFTKNVTLTSIDSLAKYRSKNEFAQAKKIIYNDNEETIELQKNAYFKNKDSEAKGETLTYNKKEDKFNLIGGGTISDSTNIVSAKKIDLNKKENKGIFTGDVIIRDTIAKTEIKADSTYIDKSQDYLLASKKNGKTLFSSEIDNDTLFVVSDTLKRKKYIVKIDSTKNDTSIIFSSFHRVKLFKSDLQGICDSMAFNEKDSIFTLFNQPIMWSDSSQFSGDTIKIYLKNKKIDRLEILQNAFVVTSDDFVYYNQIKGRKMVATFKENAIHKLYVNGNAECLYYMKDDEDAYIGANLTESSSIVFEFENKKIKHIKFYKEPNSVITPMKDADHDKMKLKGFKWEILKRPKSAALIIN
jgi:lipopolysaccharide export system protein LptA